MKSKILILTLLLFGTATQTWAQPSGAEVQFARELSEKCSGVERIVCAFVQTRSSAALARNVEKPGRYYFMQPYNVLLAFDDGDYIKITETLFEMKQNGSLTRTKVAANPMLRSMNRMLAACLSGDAAQITAGFDAGIDADGDAYRMVLLPKAGRGGRRAATIRLTFDRANMALRQMRMEEPGGDFLQYDFTDVHYNAAVDPALFDIE